MKKNIIFSLVAIMVMHLCCFAASDQIKATTYPNFELLNTGKSTIYYKLFVDKTVATNWAMIEWKALEPGKTERATFSEMVALALAIDEQTSKDLKLKTVPAALKESKALVVRLNRDRSNPDKTFYLSASVTDGKLALAPTTIDATKAEYKDIPADKNITNEELQKFVERTGVMLQMALESTVQ